MANPVGWSSPAARLPPPFLTGPHPASHPPPRPAGCQVPLCAPNQLLEELGAQRVKGLLLYGPPGCGKSLLASRLAAGLSQRPPTLVSGPEIMDKYVGNSEAQLRNLFKIGRAHV